MEEIEEFKAFLGRAAEGYSASQLQQLRGEMNAMAELLVDIHLHKRRNKRHDSNPPESFDGQSLNS